jgi:hypothetical protein
MADSTLDDVYDDPDNILADDDDDVSGAPDKDTPDDEADLSDSIYTPEKDTTDLDDRGDIDELEESDAGGVHDEMDGQYPEDEDPDSMSLGDVHPLDEEDGAER